jgi:hypothetical protein
VCCVTCSVVRCTLDTTPWHYTKCDTLRLERTLKVAPCSSPSHCNKQPTPTWSSALHPANATKRDQTGAGAHCNLHLAPRTRTPHRTTHSRFAPRTVTSRRTTHIAMAGACRTTHTHTHTHTHTLHVVPCTGRWLERARPVVSTGDRTPSASSRRSLRTSF